jgi:hypothetical protein
MDRRNALVAFPAGFGHGPGDERSALTFELATLKPVLDAIVSGFETSPGSLIARRQGRIT